MIFPTVIYSHSNLLSLPRILVLSPVDSFSWFFGAFHKLLSWFDNRNFRLRTSVDLNGALRPRCLLAICLCIYNGGAISAGIYNFSIGVSFRDKVRRNALLFRLGFWIRFTLWTCQKDNVTRSNRNRFCDIFKRTAPYIRTIIMWTRYSINVNFTKYETTKLI